MIVVMFAINAEFHFSLVKTIKQEKEKHLRVLFFYT